MRLKRPRATPAGPVSSPTTGAHGSDRNAASQRQGLFEWTLARQPMASFEGGTMIPGLLALLVSCAAAQAATVQAQFHGVRGSGRAAIFLARAIARKGGGCQNRPRPALAGVVAAGDRLHTETRSRPSPLATPCLHLRSRQDGFRCPRPRDAETFQPSGPEMRSSYLWTKRVRSL
jgi:hypothetical protein